MSQLLKPGTRSSAFVWWAIYGAIFLPLLAMQISRVALNPALFDGVGDWVKGIFIMLFLSVVINAPTANIAMSCLRFSKDIDRAAKWSALVAFGVSLVLCLIPAGLYLFWLTVTYSMATALTVWLTVHLVTRKVKRLTEAQNQEVQVGPHKN